MKYLYIALYLLLWLYILGFDPKTMALQHKRKKKQDASALIEVIWRLKSGNLATEIPKYKFFSGIVQRLVVFKKEYGGTIIPALDEIRSNIRLSVKMDKKIKDLVQGTIFQYLMISAIIFVFLSLVEIILAISVSSITKILILGYLGFGLLVSRQILALLRKKVFGTFEVYMTSLYTFKILMGLGVPLSSAIEESKIKFLPSSKQFNPIRNRLFELVKLVQTQGAKGVSEFDLISQELWDNYELSCERFQVYLNGLKLGTILVFALPCFFVCIYQLMSTISV